MRSFRRAPVAASLLLLLVLAPFAARADDAALPDRAERLLGLARLWAKVKFFHPYLATREIDWDGALVAAIPRAEAATTPAEYAAAAQTMLAVLGDPVTRILPAPTSAAAPAPPKEWLTWPSPGVLEISLAGGATAGMQPAIAEAAKAKVLLIDLRVAGLDPGTLVYLVEALEPVFPAIDQWPVERRVEQHGYRTQEGMTSGGYESVFVTGAMRAPHAAPAAGPWHVIFVADENATVPLIALALQASGHATIVGRGPLSEAGFITTTYVSLADGMTAEVRLAELIWAPPAVDVVVAANKDPLVRARAVAKTQAGKKPPAKPAKAKPAKLRELLPMRTADDADDADQPYPSRELRLLAGMKVWAVIDMFHPYRAYIDDWDQVLREFLPRLENAGDADAYKNALSEMGVFVEDGHVLVWSPANRTPRGSAPFFVRIVEKKVVVSQLLDVALCEKLGIVVGDVVESVDGKPIADAMAAQRKRVASSTEEARAQKTALSLFFGFEGDTRVVGLRGADGKAHSATVTLANANLQIWRSAPGKPHWKKLSADVGYVDLTLLTKPEVAPMFEDLKNTKSIVFDLRGYPNGTVWSIAPRVNTRKAAYGAEFLQPLVRGDNDGMQFRTRFLQPIPERGPGQSLYAGKIVVLIDDRAISQAEHTCLFLKEAAGATFIGSPTHGANGDITTMRLPGGLRIQFTGQEVRHVDGGQLQQVGIQPDIVVRPTLKGIRAGKDEVLDRALAYLKNGK